MLKKSLIIIPILFFSVFVFSAGAQVRNTDVVLSLSPEYPGANQNVTAILSSHVADLNKANISWSLDGQTVISGIGKKSYSFKTGTAGSTISVSAVIDTVDGQSFSKKTTLSIADMDLLWEADDAYTPPFYRGKALAPSQGKFKIVAMPNLFSLGQKVNSNNLSYVWKLDGNAQSDSSGWGKNYFIFSNSYLDRGNTVEVKVSDITGGTNTSGKIDLKTYNPKIVFYKDDPSLGVLWQNTLYNGFQIDKGGETIDAEPYFFSPNDLSSSDLAFTWSINGQKIATPDTKNILAVKPEDGQTGSSAIKLLVENTATLFQSISKELNVSF